MEVAGERDDFKCKGGKGEGGGGLRNNRIGIVCRPLGVDFAGEPSTIPNMKQSPLHDRHVALGARLVPFAGWEMPVQYQGIVAEHKEVRQGVGVFDISHMGEFEVRGQCTEWLDGLLTNQVSALEDAQGQYTLLLNEAGGVIDDLLIYRLSAERYFLVVNASRTDDDREAFEKHLVEGVDFRDRSPEYGAVAVQGPKSIELWEKVGGGLALPERNHVVEHGDVILCRTGYTGEEGFELFAPVASMGEWWDKITAAGAVPCGLGARDTLRLEKGYPLNGNDLDEVHTPLEAGLKFFVKLDKPGGFVGSDALAAQAEKGVPTRLAALKLLDKAPPLRHGYPVLSEDGEKTVSELTSGSLSPSLGIGIGMAYLPVDLAKRGTQLLVSIRNRNFRAEVVKKPFL